MKCFSCDSDVPVGSLFCLSCGKPLIAGTPISVSDAETVAIPKPVAEMARWIMPASGGGRFLPGTLLGGRYRIIGLVGRGGMGEIYHATDLKLEQPVALKFLPDANSADPTALARFSTEVRIARQVTHANVCRVYDIGEVQGLHYISMEYIDGEDLASLLRRIGRVPADKALEITRQLCAGLAAVHERGILHRDLKPGNIMIDGSGQVRITDFGLAGLAEHFHPDRWQSGTPQYMAPEQFEGSPASVRSDIYSLGLVLYELFTGRKPFETVRQKHPSAPQRTLRARPSEVVTELHPGVERVILSCLDEDPRNRPGSAYAVVAALPGGDPLAAALAAGVTPSPETVAFSGGSAGLPVPAALACALAVVCGLVTIVILSGRTNLFDRVELEKSPEALAQEARDWIRRLGYSGVPTDRAYGFAYSDDGVSYLEKAGLDSRRWSRAAAGHPSPLVFWYRESPRYLESSAFSVPPGRVSESNPYPGVSGMVGLSLDPRGKLLSFYAVPPRREQADLSARSDADDTLIFDATGLDATRFTRSTPTWVPPVVFDARRAWIGSYSDEPDADLRVETAYWRGRPSYIAVIGPWSKIVRMGPIELTRWGQIAQQLIVLLFLALLVGGALLARHNIRARRSDRRGAMRLAGFVFCLEMLLWCFGGSHVPTLWEAALVILAIGKAAYTAGLTWVLYVGLEPFVRRRWPSTLISWTRVLSGRIRDPLVGAHTLIGVLLGAVTSLLFQAGLLWNHGIRLSAMAGIPSVNVLLGGRHVAQQLVFYLDDAINKAMTQLFLIVVLRVVVRRSGVAAALSVAILTFLGVSWTPPGMTEIGTRDPVILVVIVGTGVALVISALVRFGLLTTVIGILTFSILTEFPITSNISSWYFGTALAGLFVVLGITAYGYQTAAGGRTWLGDLMLKT